MIETKLHIPSTIIPTGCDVATQFERDLGIVLSVEERQLVCQLEAVRLSGVPPRVYVYDRGGIDSRQLLMRYFGWLDYADNYAAVIAPSVALARKLTPPAGASLFSAANYDGVRSKAFTHVLILDARPRNYQEVLRAAVSGVPMIESTFVIIHSSHELLLPPAFVEPIESAVRKAETLDETVADGNTAQADDVDCRGAVTSCSADYRLISTGIPEKPMICLILMYVANGRAPPLKKAPPPRGQKRLKFTGW